MTITQQFRARECVARAIAVLGGHDSEVRDLLNEAYELLDNHEEQAALEQRQTWLVQRGQPSGGAYAASIREQVEGGR